MTTEKVIYAIGHQNPDTDSICSSHGFAYLQRALGKNVIAARCGNPNKESQFALDYFGVEAQKLVPDIYPRVNQIMTKPLAVAHPGDTLQKMGTVMAQEGLRALPVINDQEELLGIVTVGDLAKAYVHEIALTNFADRSTDVASIAEVLSGDIIVPTATVEVNLDVQIIAACVKRYEDKIRPNAVVVLSERGDEAYRKCILKNISCLILTDGVEISEEIVALAKAENVTIISTKHDAFNTARLLPQVARVACIMSRDVVSFNSEDKLKDVLPMMDSHEYHTFPVVENGKLVGIINKDTYKLPEPQEVMLCDHNELAQAVPGIETGKILSVVDHHRFGGLQTADPIRIDVRPVGCTCTIVTNLYREHGVEIPKEIAGLLMSAIISDTVLFKSPTCTEQDKEAVFYLSKIAGVDYEEYGLKMLKAGADIGDMTPAQIVKNDSKPFQFGPYKAIISQLSVMDTDQVMAMKDAIVADMQEVCATEGYDLSLVMVTDIIKEGTILLFTGEPSSLVAAAFGQEATNNEMFLPGVMSRKKQIVPPLTNAVDKI